MSLSKRRRGSRTSSATSLAMALAPSSVGLSAVGSHLMAGEVDDMSPEAVPTDVYSEENTKWTSVQHSIISMFHGKKPTAMEMTYMGNCIKEMTESAIGPLLYDFYKTSLLTRGMQILFFKLDTSSKESLISSLESTWWMFFTEIIPVLQILMQPIVTPNVTMNCRRTAAVAFRDKVVLKCDLEPILRQPDFQASPHMKQMMLMLQLARDGEPPNDNYLALEKLVSLVVSPLLGYMGLYDDKGDLVVKATHQSQTQKATESRLRTTSASLVSLPRLHVHTTTPVNIPGSAPLSPLAAGPQSLLLGHHRQMSTSSVSGLLETVEEDDRPALPPPGLGAALGSGSYQRRRHTLNDTVIRGQLLKSKMIVQNMG